MIITTRTKEQKEEDKQRWKRRFAFLPVQVQDGEWRWLEFYEERYVNLVPLRPTLTLLGIDRRYRQRRAAGSEDAGYPPLPRPTRPPRPFSHLTEGCDRPPKGWRCARSLGHSGPCAIVPVRPPAKPSNQG